jgi:hypothetical protein
MVGIKIVPNATERECRRGRSERLGAEHALARGAPAWCNWRVKRTRRSARKRAWTALLFRALIAVALTAAIVELPRSPARAGLVRAKSELSAAYARPHDTTSLEAIRLGLRVMPAPVAERLPPLPTLHGPGPIAEGVLRFGHGRGAPSTACVAATRVRLWRRIPRMGPDEPPRSTRFS